METSLKRGGEGESGTEKIESVSETQNSLRDLITFHTDRRRTDRWWEKWRKGRRDGLQGEHFMKKIKILTLSEMM